MTSQALVKVVKDGSPALVKKLLPLPTPGRNQALVRVSRAAQNPTDVFGFDANSYEDGAVLGCDFAGTVEEVGSDVTRLSKGDVVAGIIWGGKTAGIGAFAEHTLADEGISFKIPSSISPAQAATIPLASLTSLLALFSNDCLNIDSAAASDTSVLVWGGSSSVGLYAIQIAALHGLKVVTTCSPRHFDHVRAVGAAHAFDYNDANVVESIKKAAPGLKYFFDTIGSETSSTKGSEALDEQGGTMCTVRPNKAFTDNVSKQTKVTPVLMWTSLYEGFHFRETYWPANKGDQKLAREFMKNLPEYLENGKIKPNVPKIVPGGLDGVAQGFQDHRDKKISGYKVVYEL